MNCFSFILNNRYVHLLKTQPATMARVVAVCGMPGSGKGEFANIMAKNGCPVFSMGDMIRHEVKIRGLEEAPEIFGIIAAELREKFGDDVLAVRLADRIDSESSLNSMVLIEGLRGTAEYEIFKNRWGDDFSTVAIVAKPDTRFARIQARGRSEDGNYEQFLIRETRESGWGLNDLIDTADYKLSNEGSLQEFTESCESWLASLN